MKRVIVLTVGVVTLLIGYFFANAQTESKLTNYLKNIIVEKGENATVKAWIYFADKGVQVESKLAAAETNLTPHALKRRLRNRGAGNLVDFKDIPVNREYFQEIKTCRSPR